MPQQDLFTLCYISRRAPGLTDAQVIDGIVLPAMAKNRRLDITGCLWFDANRFIQFLEGPAKDVQRVYAAIERDNRHTDVSLLTSGPLAERSFERFSMRAIGRSRPAAVAALLELCDGVGVQTARARDDLVAIVGSVTSELRQWPLATA